MPLGHHCRQFPQMLRPALGHRIRKLRQPCLPTKRHAFHLDITIRQSIALQQKINPAVLTVLHLGKHIRIGRQRRNRPCPQRFANDLVGHRRINHDHHPANLRQLPAIPQLALGVVVRLQPNRHPLVLHSKHRTGVRHMRRHFAPIFKLYVRKEALVSSKQSCAYQLCLKIHADPR